jgi:hypothetical protein
MNLIEVTNSATAREFIDLPKKLYKNDPNWICPLDSDIEAVFNPGRNVFFTHGECIRWILKDDNNQLVGRVAAFINRQKAFKNPQPTGGIGFFESIQDKKVAYLLFDTAKKWLQDRGMQAMEGPVNFGENDKFWGLLVDGFKPPSLGMNYNPPYYQEFFESYGFEKSYDQFTNFLDPRLQLPERFIKISDWVMKKPGYAFRPFDKTKFDKFASDFREVYNDAWSTFDNFTPIEMATIRESFRQMKAIMHEKFLYFAYYNEEPIAFVVCLPDVNQILKHINGKLNLIGKLKFLWYKKTTRLTRLRIVIMGIKIKYQNKGLESALIRCLQLESFKLNTIEAVELAWVGDFNDKMLAIHEAVGATKDKVHRTYRCIF